MTKANECTCPSGDGSLRHPCPAHPAPVEQAGGDERAAFRPAQVISYRPGVGEVTIYVAGRVPGYMNIGDTVYVSDRAPVEQPIAALAQPSPAQAEQAEAERPPQPERYTADVFHPERPYYTAQTSVVRASDFDEFATQYERIVGALRFERQQMDRAFTACINERDAALARVAELEHVLRVVVNAADHGSWPTTVMHGIEQVREVLAGSAPPVKAQPEETPGEILAAKLIETWVTKHGKPAPWSTAVEITAVATNMPNDERDRLLALDDDVDAQAQHSVPGKYDDVLLPFLKSMEHELHANAGKGDRPGWLQMDRRTALLEIYYHLAKLQKATKDNDAAGIVEYAADVANMSMMLVDVCGLLAAAPGKEEV
ncbi:hypothetical protein [Pseudomonas aeruginosa]|uniref:hypothetical protein n=1 Tax=Pseudomonas aeruginosa TaxID=287 RepID=UPI002934EF79|nr:hypothetical protein [Pseudomonas aeruginosa]